MRGNHTFLVQRQHVRYPLIESANTLTGTAGQALFYQITTTNLPQSFSASGLPAGVTLDTQTGVISGRPLAAGTFAVVLIATNAYGTDTAEMALTILVDPAQTAALPLGSTPSPQLFL